MGSDGVCLWMAESDILAVEFASYIRLEDRDTEKRCNH